MTTKDLSRVMSIIVRHHRRNGSIDDADLRDALIEFRQKVIVREMPKTNPKTGVLRRSMIDALIRFRPTNKAELDGLLPKYLLNKTDKAQLERYSAEIIQIINLAILTRPRPSA